MGLINMGIVYVTYILFHTPIGKPDLSPFLERVE